MMIHYLLDIVNQPRQKKGGIIILDITITKVRDVENKDDKINTTSDFMQMVCQQMQCEDCKRCPIHQEKLDLRVGAEKSLPCWYNLKKWYNMHTNPALFISEGV